MEASTEVESGWCLEGFVDPDKRVWRTMIRSVPIVVGRHSGADLQLLSDKVSNHHAEIFWAEEQLWVKDLSSTNGTFLNGERLLDPARLALGDALRFADVEMRLGRYVGRGDTRTRTLGLTDLEALDLHRREIDSLIDTHAVRALYQPVVRLDDLTVMGYELLSRGDLDGLETGPTELLHIAELLGREAELSQLFREHGVKAARGLAGAFRLFLNTHPAELLDPHELTQSLSRLRENWPDLRMVIEIHEAALTDPETMCEIREALHRLDVELAFDDFGTGQSRLMAIGEAPPDFLKFDLAFIRDLDAASPSRKKLVHELVRLTSAMGILPIAEGIETDGELEACREAGFAWAQGFALGRLGGPSELPTAAK